MKLSIIVPVYNVEAYLRQCVMSVFDIDCEKEIILVDDGSSDNSGKICDQFASEYDFIKAIHKENGGLSDARNCGVKNCCGDYVMFLDSDDMIDATEFKKIIPLLDLKNKIICGLYKEYYKSEEMVDEINPFKNSGLLNIQDYLTAVEKYQDKYYMIAWRYIVLRDLIMNNNLYFPIGIYHEDEYWTENLFFFIDSIYVMDSRYYLYRKNREGSITNNYSFKHMNDKFVIIENCYQLYEKSSQSLKEYYKYRAGNLYLDLILHYKYISKNQQKELKNRYAKYYDFSIDKINGIIKKAMKLMRPLLGMFGSFSLISSLYKIRNRIKR